MSDKSGFSGRTGRKSAPSLAENKDRFVKHLVRRPPHLARRKSNPWPEILSVLIIGIGLTVFPWHVFRSGPETATDTSPWGSATTTHGEAFSAVPAQCKDVAKSAPGQQPSGQPVQPKQCQADAADSAKR